MSVEIIIEHLRGRRVMIAGYGREGRSTHAFIQQHLPQQQVNIAENDDAIHHLLGSNTYDLILKSPGIPMRVFEGYVPRNLISSQTDLFLLAFAAQTIGVTATKGKSTTAALLSHILRHSGRQVIMAGNMGIPLLDIVDQITPQTLIVAELSCHQLECIHRAPHISLLMNLFQEHLDHYKDYRDYQNAKLQILCCQQPGDAGIYCADNQLLCERVAELRTQIASRLIAYNAPQSPAWAADFPLQGAHNLSNAEAVRLALAEVGITPQQFADALPSFTGLEHRLERVGTHRGITFYNDSISTIPEAAIAAVEALRSVDTLILGGFDRGIDYTPLMDYLTATGTLGSQVRNLVFVGQAGRRMAAQIEGRMQGRQLIVEDDYSRIVDWCYQHTAPGRICLLSPAAASYDMFKNFEERGRCFKDLVNSEYHPS